MNVVFLGCTQGYGYNYSAANTKTELIAKGLFEQGCNCTIINSVVGQNIPQSKEILRKEFGKVITFRKKGKQFISWLINIIPLYKVLKEEKGNGEGVLVLEFPYYHLFLLYVLLGRLLGYRITVIAHEWGSTLKNVKRLRRCSMWLYSKTFGYMVDGILPISEYIIDKIRHFNKPYIKVPVLADFDETDNSEAEQRCAEEKSFFLYCVYAAYTRVIYFIIDAYAITKKHAQFEDKLVLVLAGDDNQVKAIADYIIEKKMENDILIKRRLPYKELLELYSKSIALIIPLDPDSEQDHARFSQKIAEYTSSKSPIITNWVGEIPNYFHKNKDVIIAPEFSKDGFEQAFLWCLSHKAILNDIGFRGYCIGKKEFNYKTMGTKLFDFFKTL